MHQVDGGTEGESRARPALDPRRLTP